MNSKLKDDAKASFNVAEAANYLGVSEATIWHWMAEGAISSTWVDGCTRLSREALQAVVEPPEDEEPAAHRGPCTACGHTGLVPGYVQGSGRVYFRPARGKFRVLTQAFVPLQAYVCPACGHVHLFVDAARLQRLMPADDEPRT